MRSVSTYLRNRREPSSCAPIQRLPCRADARKSHSSPRPSVPARTTRTQNSGSTVGTSTAASTWARAGLRIGSSALDRSCAAAPWPACDGGRGQRRWRGFRQRVGSDRPIGAPCRWLGAEAGRRAGRHRSESGLMGKRSGPVVLRVRSYVRLVGVYDPRVDHARLAELAEDPRRHLRRAARLQLSAFAQIPDRRGSSFRHWTRGSPRGCSAAHGPHVLAQRPRPAT